MQSRIFGVLFVIHCTSLAQFINVHYGTSNDHQKYPSHVLHNTLPSTGPYFDTSTTSITNVFVEDGEDAFLVCSVINLGRNVISWIRHNDINLLSVGKIKYTQDQRFQIFHEETNDTWILKINRVKKYDEGYFECQISTPQPVGHKIYLKIIDPEITIPGEDGYKLEHAGSNFNLTCYIRQILNETIDLKWTHNDQEINHQSPRGGVFIITEHDAVTVSQLIIKNLTVADSGQYSCSTSTKSRKSITLHVVNEEMTDESMTINKSLKTSSTFLILFLYFLTNFIL